MQTKTITRSTLAAGAALLGAAAHPADKPVVDKAALDKAFEKLGTFNWGDDRKALAPIDDAVVATHGDAEARKALETRLAAVLGSATPRAAKDFACRALTIIGTAESTPALAALLPNPELSHMARYALERIPAPEAAAALRDALPKVQGKLKIGVAGSLGVRRDAEAVGRLAELLCDEDADVAAAAAAALGNIGNAEAAKALRETGKSAPKAAQAAVADALLAAAERLLADGKKAEAMAVYNALLAGNPPKNVRLAATRGRLMVSGKKQ